jgi:hypothetical protein
LARPPILWRVKAWKCSTAPCQGFNMIGKRALDDPRNSLVYRYYRARSKMGPEVRPRETRFKYRYQFRRMTSVTLRGSKSVPL